MHSNKVSLRGFQRVILKRGLRVLELDRSTDLFEPIVGAIAFAVTTLTRRLSAYRNSSTWAVVVVVLVGKAEFKYKFFVISNIMSWTLALWLLSTCSLRSHALSRIPYIYIRLCFLTLVVWVRFCFCLRVRWPASLELRRLLAHDGLRVAQYCDLARQRLELLCLSLRRLLYLEAFFLVQLVIILVCESLFKHLILIGLRITWEIRHYAFIQQHVDNVIPSNVLRKQLVKLGTHLRVCYRNRTLSFVILIRCLQWEHLFDLLQCCEKIFLLYVPLMIIFKVLKLVK